MHVETACKRRTSNEQIITSNEQIIAGPRGFRPIRIACKNVPRANLQDRKETWGAMKSSSNSKPASTELTGGAGFSYEDTVVAYYLSSLLRRERATGQSGFVTSVAVQQLGHGNPMDDLVAEFNDMGTKRV